MAIQPDFPATQTQILEALQRLIEVVAQLRNPEGGCPWDLEQTQTTLIPYVLEEAYEVVDALKSGDQTAIADELGDLLLQVILQAQVAKDDQQFDLALVATTITEKLIRRHPHVFGEVSVENAEEVHRNWEAIKATEKPEETRLSQKMKRYARSLPPMTATMKISKKAAKVGFEWESIDGVWEKFHEELDELRHAIEHESRERQESELGDLLFSLLQIARWQGLDPVQALQGTNDRFIQRLSQMEQAVDRSLESYSLAELEALWQQAKKQLGQ
ncbi:nucleoside triphosphate pyrophosphohydrolase [Alkalinema sp. FACHB-956]|uniref:nucleoside triphosphate pyrophosphohydrolase n=1 Tax=Alkalinema sp. FACHB-956 TaxID=2692768 RepID=UPI00168462C0|nr:nucleoside triphosphate pyrophosphohydrolase [Alkalinema sp. FACHB-956]MBD2328261.1 nucleoside triphosphate pyrophosphohydrolase [Alkalinema sp. FACHB-956]